MEQKLDLAVLRANMLFRNLTDEEVLGVIDTMSPHTVLWTAAPCPTSCARCGTRGF